MGTGSSGSASPPISPALSAKNSTGKDSTGKDSSGTKAKANKSTSFGSASGYSINVDTSFGDERSEKSGSPEPDILNLQLHSSKKSKKDDAFPGRKTSSASILSPREALALSQIQARSPVFKAKRVTSSASSDSLKLPKRCLEPPPPPRTASDDEDEDEEMDEETKRNTALNSLPPEPFGDEPYIFYVFVFV